MTYHRHLRSLHSFTTKIGPQKVKHAQRPDTYSKFVSRDFSRARIALYIRAFQRRSMEEFHFRFLSFGFSLWGTRPQASEGTSSSLRMGARHSKGGATRNQDRSNPDAMDIVQPDINSRNRDVAEIEANPKHPKYERGKHFAFCFFSYIAKPRFSNWN